MGAIVYVIFGSCKDITIGPTALMALMTHDYVQGRNADFAILLAFLSGWLQLLMACLRLGMLNQTNKKMHYFKCIGYAIENKISSEKQSIFYSEMRKVRRDVRRLCARIIGNFKISK